MWCKIPALSLITTSPHPTNKLKRIKILKKSFRKLSVFSKILEWRIWQWLVCHLVCIIMTHYVGKLTCDSPPQFKSSHNIKERFLDKHPWQNAFLKVGLSPFKKILFICFNDSPSKMKKNTFYFILKALLVVKIFPYLSWLFGHAEKAAWLER